MMPITRLRGENSSRSTADAKNGAKSPTSVDDHPPCTTEEAERTFAESSASSTTLAAVHGIQQESDDERSKSSQPMSRYEKYFSLDSVVTFFERTVMKVVDTMPESNEIHLQYNQK